MDRIAHNTGDQENKNKFHADLALFCFFATVTRTRRVRVYRYEDGYFSSIPEGGVVKVFLHRTFLRDPRAIKSCAIQSIDVEQCFLRGFPGIFRVSQQDLSEIPEISQTFILKSSENVSKRSGFVLEVHEYRKFSPAARKKWCIIEFQNFDSQNSGL